LLLDHHLPDPKSVDNNDDGVWPHPRLEEARRLQGIKALVTSAGERANEADVTTA